MTSTGPLSGLRIAVTRPQRQVAKLTTAIEAAGGICIQYPLLEILPLADSTILNGIAAGLHTFDLAIFISPNAVQYAMQTIQNSGGMPASLQVACVGLSSANALRAYGINKVLVPQHRFDSESLLALPELQQVNGKKVVIFRGDKGRELLGDTLQQRGATVEYVACYQRNKAQHDIADLLAARPDMLCISSSEGLSYLQQLLNAGAAESLMQLPLYVTHERIALAARKQGWQNVIVAAAGDEGLLSDLIAWAHAHEEHKHE
ncbi:MAG: uroporphyrinogen-III synthase [Gallionellaceae bacterium]|jgi:uroporphyrinogen-III synthase